MFTAIFQYELLYWWKNPHVYIYAAIVFLIAMAVMGAEAGMPGEVSAGSISIANSPMNIYLLTGLFNKLMLLLIPAIVGNSIYRDFRYQVHTILFSFPFRKTAYLAGKLMSSLLVVCLIAAMVFAGFYCGTQLPGVNHVMIAAFDPEVYLQVYFLYLVPNMMSAAILVFTTVLLSRNIYTGFISIIVILILREMVLRLTAGSDAGIIGLLLDPFGESAFTSSSDHLSQAEVDLLPLQLNAAIICNRLFWLFLSLVLLLALYSLFSLSQHAIFKRPVTRDTERNIKSNFYTSIRRKLPETHLQFNFISQCKLAWRLSTSGYKAIYSSRSFIIVLAISLLFVFVLLMQMNPPYETRVLPLTWVMLAFPLFFFSLFINFITFLYAGVLIHRDKTYRIHELVDTTPAGNPVLLISKFLTLIRIQVLLLAVVMLTGISVQLFNGYYHFEIGHYLFDLYGIHLIGFIIWAAAAIFIQSIFMNSYFSLFCLVLLSFGISELPKLGIESTAFSFNQNAAPDFFLKYSDMSGYGHSLIPYYVYKIYWGILSLFLLLTTLVLWPRGISETFIQRINKAKSSFRKYHAIAAILTLILFSCTGYWIFTSEKTVKRLHTEKELAALITTADNKYRSYSRRVQPRIMKVQVRMHIFPQSRNFQASGIYTLRNNSIQMIDTLLISTSYDVYTNYNLSKSHRVIMQDSILHLIILHLDHGLKPGDSLQLSFGVRNIPNTLLRKNSIVESDGTFITSTIFPVIGYRASDTEAQPASLSGLQNHYRSSDADHIDFETIVSTSEDQIAIAPGYLEKTWKENGRNFFYYKSIDKVTNDYAFISGQYEVARQYWNTTLLEIYYHKGHAYNLAHMFNGLKAALAYNEKYFSPYQHQHIRIAEYSRAQGNYAQSFANTMPYSESGFIINTDDSKSNSLNLPFLGSAHEVAHQWWGHQVTPADVRGARMITESMAEYVSLKVLQHEYGKEKLHQFLRKSLDIYHRKRTEDTEVEQPLMYNTGLKKSHIPYQKGSLALYAMSEYIGEDSLNRALKLFLQKAKFQNAPYTTSIEMTEAISQATPESLQYLVRDLFETVTLYDNKLLSSKATAKPDGKYDIEITFEVVKYRINSDGQKMYCDTPGHTLSFKPVSSDSIIQSLPLADYIEIGVTLNQHLQESQVDQINNIQQLRVTEIYNKIIINTDHPPLQVTIDPFLKLIDVNTKDNSKAL